MATTAPMRANEYVITAISARSRAHQPGLFGFRAVGQRDLPRDLDAPQQPPGLVLGEHRRLAAAYDMLGATHRVRRVDGEDLADDESVEQQANCGQMHLTVG